VNLDAWVLFGVLVLGAMGGGLFLSWMVERLLKRLGLQVHVFHVTEEEPEPAGEQNPEQTQQAANDPDAMHGNGAIISGRCRGCDLIHVGLIPAFIELIGPGEFNIPGGVPAVCPRCWVKMNPDKLTNVVPMPKPPPEPDNRQNRPPLPPVPKFGPPLIGGEGAPEPIQLDDVQDVRKISDEPKEMDFAEPPPQPSHRTSGYPAEPPLADKPVGELTDEELEQLMRPNTEAPKEPAVRCNKCGGGTGPFRPQIKEGKLSGKFWCQGCIDALGGPGKAKRKGRKGE